MLPEQEAGATLSTVTPWRAAKAKDAWAEDAWAVPLVAGSAPALAGSSAHFFLPASPSTWAALP